MQVFPKFFSPGMPGRIPRRTVPTRVSHGEDNASPSSIRLRPRVESCPTRRSVRIVARAHPRTIRVVRNDRDDEVVSGRAMALPTALRLPNTFPITTTTTTTTTHPSSPAMSLSSESSNSTLSSGSSNSTLSSGGSSDHRAESLVRQMREAAEYAVWLEGYRRETERVDIDHPTPRDDSALIEILTAPSGRFKCVACGERIGRDAVMVDFRPFLSQRQHSHIGCYPNIPALAFPGDRRVRFHDSIGPEWRQTHLRTIRTDRPRTPESIHLMNLDGTPQEDRARFPRHSRNGDGRYRLARERQRTEVAGIPNRSQRWHPNITVSEYLGSFSGTPPDISARELMRGMPHSRQVYSPPIGGLFPSILSTLPKIRIQTCSPTDDPCVICLEQMAVGCEVTVLPCFHRFHSNCVGSWLKHSKLCPIDKLDIAHLVAKSHESSRDESQVTIFS